MTADQIRYLNEYDPSRSITGPNHTGSVAQQVNAAVASYLNLCDLDLGVAPPEAEVHAEIVKRLEARGVAVNA